MRANAVKRVQPPGGVRDRVKAWQKSNAAVIATGDADDAATEPTDVAFDGEEIESVTEEDRIRIKMRKKRKNGLKLKPPVVKQSGSGGSAENTGDEDSIPPPRKRVVSDDNWMKTRAGRKSPIGRKVSPRHARRSPSGGAARIPKDFTMKTAANPNVSNRVKAWADKVEVPDTPPPRSYRSSKSRERSVDAETEARSDGGSSQATARQSLRHRTKGAADDGIRVRAVRKKKPDDDGIRVTPINSVADEDASAVSTDITASTDPNPPRQRRKTLPSESSVQAPDSDGIIVVEEPTELSQSTGVTQSTESDQIHVTEKPESALSTPTKRKGTAKRHPAKERPKSYHPGVFKAKDDASWIDDSLDVSRSQLLGSDVSSSLANKSVADLPGEIPWGHSAFSELDLPLNGPARSRPKQQAKPARDTSLKGMNGVFKKVMEGGKKIIGEMNEPPRPVNNNPPSIEKWLTNTVDPFVDQKDEASAEKEPKKESKQPTPEPKAKEATPEPAKQPTPEPKRESRESKSPQPPKQSTPETPRRKDTVRRKSSHETKTSTQSSHWRSASILSEDLSAQSTESTEVTPKSGSTSKPKTPESGGLRRSRAVRSTSTPTKNGKRPFFGMLKEAFQGESAQRTPSFSYQSQETRYDEDEYSDDQTMSGYETRSGYTYDETPTASELTTSSAESAEPIPRMAGPRLRPPTNGHHELSTIMSEESSSAIDSDLTSSSASNSTLTQSTTISKDSELSRSKSKDQGPGLKRRLTKHSDLVSVLSLPDNASIPETIKCTRSRPSLRKTRGHVDHVSAEELLREFSDDEGLYMRELKTLVDGVVPVLLSQVVQDGHATELFGSTTEKKLDSLSKSVVGMGVALEKLRNAHKKAPHHDLRKLAHWAHGVVPVYNSYLNSWRLGFQDLIVNLAPAAGVPEDEDSLLNAMPRNESGDVIGADGERVDIAHLLKRPLIRIKHLVKFIECVDSMMPSEDNHELLKNFRDLQMKSRRRHREETARLADEEASNTDTTRSRDLRTLGAIETVRINPNRQVNAKDSFSLYLEHSNGQRLECQVELVHRDNQKDSGDPGDLLIRETGDSGRAYLLFPPIHTADLSARTGDGNFDMVVMVRGWHKDRQWHELLTLTSDNEDQILDWLDILPLSPVPPREPEPSVIGADEEEETFTAKPVDIPVGARSIRRKGGRHMPRDRDDLPSQRNQSTPKRSQPSRHHSKRPLPSTPPPVIQEEDDTRERTPTQEDYPPYSPEPDRSRPLHESMRPDPLRLKKSSPKYQRDDGAPPPPIHRTLSVSPQPEESDSQQKQKPSLDPPEQLKSKDKVKRRTSSPLKHEYLPSDGSSASGVSHPSDSDPSEYSDDSDDDLESIDVPETELGVSLKHQEQQQQQHREQQQPPMPAPVESVLDSECSLTPSNSASQAGIHGTRAEPEAEVAPTPEQPQEQSVTRYMASISRWSDRGAWKDVTSTPCAIVVQPGLIEAYTFNSNGSQSQKPLLAMDLTPLVLIRQSTTVDLEIRSSMQAHCQLYEAHGGGNFRFRCGNGPDCFSLYMSVHHARLNNQKFIQLENEARFRSFGEKQQQNGDEDSSSRRKSWFGRKNSYRGSTRAPSTSHDGASTTPSSSISASSFLKRITVAGNMTFNLARSTVDKQSRPGSTRNSLYSSSSGTPPRSPSISIENSGHSGTPRDFNSENMRIRLHLLVSAAKWEDYGNCSLQIRRPPPGWHQALRADHGLEKRITVTTLPRRDSEPPRILLDAVLGSGCFQPMGSRGIVCGVWEEVKDGNGMVGAVPATGATGGMIKKWCFQCASVAEASWVLRLVHQEVMLRA